MKPKKKLEQTPYFIGLDIGTSSVGWAVTNKDYEVLKFNGKMMWGSRLFTEASTAADRRIHRSNRRRLMRRKYRLNLLESIFSEEISKVDKGFFIRLKESKYHLEDKTVDTKNVLFNDGKLMNDKEYFKKYPTIYHLRSHLLNGGDCDVRELFLALHSMIKYRGHFLIESSDLSSNGNIKDLLYIILHDNELNLDEDEFKKGKLLEDVESLLLKKDLTRNDKAKKIASLFSKSKNKQMNEIFKLILGLKCNLSTALDDEELKDADSEIATITFSKDFETIESKLESELGDRYFVIGNCKSLYNAIILSSILVNGKSLSESKVISYEKHKSDLKKLKDILKQNKDLYNSMFNEDKDKGTNYVNYSNNSSNGTGVTREDFYKYVEKTLKNVSDNETKEYILNEIKLESFMPLQRTGENSAVPNQIHLEEMIKILENYEDKFEFINKIDENGISNKDKIISLMKFRIPYYVGPINTTHRASDKTGYSWAIKKKDEKVLPWNFEDVIDIESTAEAFINNLTNKCGRIPTEDVLPKNSLLYSEFVLLNELNNISYDGQRLPVNVKIDFIEEVFKSDNHKKITKNRILEFLKSKGLDIGQGVIGGIDDSIKSDLKSYRDMTRILGDDFNVEMAEKLILWITIFGDEKKILKSKIEKTYGDKISEKQIKELCKLRYKDWGSLSRKFLTEIHDDKIKKDIEDVFFEESVSIIDSLRFSKNNLSELLSDKYGFSKSLELYNKQFEKEVTEFDYSILDDIYASPAVKRSIWQSIKIVEEIKSIMKHAPEKIFIETTRSNKFDKNSKKNKELLKQRKKRLEDLYKDYGNAKELHDEIKSREDKDFQSKKMYLYYQQMSKCMYCNKEIHLHDLFTNQYDIDHIYPRSKTKDDSFDNLVLVHKTCNKEKDDIYPISKKVYDLKKDFWGMLNKNGFISDKKYKRLMSRDSIDESILSGFIARQIVHTSQSSKAAIEYLQMLNPESTLCWIKAENVSDFRNGTISKKNKNSDTIKFVKVRELNDHHHAKDAYLNIVVGNVFNEKFTKNPSVFIKESKDEKEDKYKYNLVYPFSSTLHYRKNKDELCWSYDKHMPIVQKMMKKNDVRVSKMPIERTDELFKATIHKGKNTKSDSYFPLKLSDINMNDMSKYGGYKSISVAYNAIIRYKYIDKKGNNIESIRIIPIPIYIEKNDLAIENYAISSIKLKEKEILKEVNIIYNKLCLDSIVNINGFVYYMGGKTNDLFYADSALQVVLDEDTNMVLKAIINYLNKRKNNIDIIPQNQQIEKDRFLSDDELIKIFNSIVQKYSQNIFSKKTKYILESVLDEKVIKAFENLDCDNKCKSIMALLNLLTERKTTYDDLKDIEVTASRRTINLCLDKVDYFSVINQSITGLFENEVVIIDKKNELENSSNI